MCISGYQTEHQDGIQSMKKLKAPKITCLPGLMYSNADVVESRNMKLNIHAEALVIDAA